jgi:hypothetical protein
MLGRQRRFERVVRTGCRNAGSSKTFKEGCWNESLTMFKKGWDGLSKTGHWKLVDGNWLMKSFKDEGNGLSELAVRNVERRLEQVVGKCRRQCSMKFGTGR